MTMTPERLGEIEAHARKMQRFNELLADYVLEVSADVRALQAQLAEAHKRLSASLSAEGRLVKTLSASEAARERMRAALVEIRNEMVRKQKFPGYAWEIVTKVLRKALASSPASPVTTEGARNDDR